MNAENKPIPSTPEQPQGRLPKIAARVRRALSRSAETAHSVDTPDITSPSTPEAPLPSIVPPPEDPNHPDSSDSSDFPPTILANTAFGRVERALAGLSTLEDELHTLVAKAGYEKDIITDPDRAAARSPIEVEENPENIIGYFTGKEFWDAKGETMPDIRRYDRSEKRHDPTRPEKEQGPANRIGHIFEIPEGKVLVIEGIPADPGEFKAGPYSDENPLRRKSVQVSRNKGGYLTATKVVDKDGSVTGGLNAKKQVSNRGGERNIQLLTTTGGYYTGDGISYTKIETTIITPDDAGDTVEVGFTKDIRLLEKHGPITFRLIDDIPA